MPRLDFMRPQRPRNIDTDMDLTRLRQTADCRWELEPEGRMRVPCVIFGSAELMAEMDEQVLAQLRNVAALPGIRDAAYAMPDAHWGYGFPIGGVAAFDADEGGVVSAGGVGFDISCGVRTLLTGITADEIQPRLQHLSDALFVSVPAGLGSRGSLRLDARETDAMLAGGAAWAVARGHGAREDLERIEHGGVVEGADPAGVSEQARKRQRDEMGTLGSGNDYLEVQRVAEVLDAGAAAAFNLREGEITVSIHCGSRGLGHQVATEFSKSMLAAAREAGLDLPDRELACAPLHSKEGAAYMGAMRAAANCALANRQILTHLVRNAFEKILPGSILPVLYDVSHNLCSQEAHEAGGRVKKLFVHRKGATRAFGPGHPDIPAAFRAVGQPVLIGGTMGTESYVLAGGAGAGAFGSACHGAGRRMSRSQALRRWQGRDVIRSLELRRIIIRTSSFKGIAEEAPGAYKDAGEVIRATARAGLARPVARLEPMICLKG